MYIYTGQFVCWGVPLHTSVDSTYGRLVWSKKASTRNFLTWESTSSSTSSNSANSDLAWRWSRSSTSLFSPNHLANSTLVISPLLLVSIESKSPETSSESISSVILLAFKKAVNSSLVTDSVLEISLMSAETPPSAACMAAMSTKRCVADARRNTSSFVLVP